MTAMRWLACGLIALSLAGCVSHPVRPLPTLSVAELAAASARQAAHEAWAREHRAWSLQGRVALSNGRDGGSGRMDWRQQDLHYDVSLSAPVTRQSWRLSGDETAATLAGLEGGTRSGTDPAALLREATRWEIPVTALTAWVRGARADEASHGRATLGYGADGRLSRIEQAGWVIDYGAWQATQGTELPVRLEARRADAKVRLIVDAWDGADAP
ncbi:MAG: outer membrane lipoprotein LolB [Luteimonas sp.]|nr:outer membrane lipoprotein LolB [Luteimonas sp.]